MLKILAILCLALNVSGQPNHTRGDKNTVSNKQPPSTVPTYTYNADCCATQAPQKSDEKSQRWYAPLEDSNWWLVIVAAITGGFIGWQAWETREAAETAADAVKLSREEFIANFRPKIHIRKLRLVWDGESMSPIRVAIYFVNVGQSTAHITGGELQLNRIFGMNPHEKDWVSHAAVHQFKMLPGETRDAEISHGGLATFCAMIQLETDSKGAQESWLECTGKIEYSDSSGTKRTTAFCRRYDVIRHQFAVLDIDREDDYED
jgi:hypothetical protein